MHDHSFLILLLMLSALALNVCVWIAQDVQRTNKETEEIEHWLENGEKGDMPHGN